MFAVLIGVLLELLLQTLAHPLATFSFHLELGFAERLRA